jgi:hypothetical protein
MGLPDSPLGRPTAAESPDPPAETAGGSLLGVTQPDSPL